METLSYGQLLFRMETIQASSKKASAQSNYLQGDWRKFFPLAGSAQHPNRRHKSPWEGTLSAQGTSCWSCSLRFTKSPWADAGSKRGPSAGAVTVLELLFLSKAISAALNKRLLTVRRESSITLIFFSSVYPVPAPLAMFRSKQACWAMEATGMPSSRNHSLSR